VSEEARAAVEAAIRDHGPITFAEFMELALYGPGGYYRRPRVGPDGDFVTSPHVHPVFGELLGLAVRELWSALGRPDPFRLVEVGAGDGTLARQLLAATSALPVRYVAVEVGEGARDALHAIDGVTALASPPEAADLVLAHELLDNLPFRVVRGGREVRVALAPDGTLVEEEVPLDEALRALGPPADGVVPIGALAFVDRLADVLDPGYALLIDYGGVGAPGGDVHGYRGHRVVEDVLADPGETDVTAGVDMALVAERARGTGLEPHGPWTQHDALMALGFERWTRVELARQHELLDARDGLGAVRAWSGRSRSTLLVDPGGLGRLRWLLLASPGLPVPAWAASLEG